MLLYSLILTQPCLALSECRYYIYIYIYIYRLFSPSDAKQANATITTFTNATASCAYVLRTRSPPDSLGTLTLQYGVHVWVLMTPVVAIAIVTKVSQTPEHYTDALTKKKNCKVSARAAAP